MRLSLNVLLFFAALLPLRALAGEPAPHAAATEAPPALTESQREARTLMMGMANFLAGLDACSVKVRAGYDVVQQSGQKIEFLEVRDVTLDRPNRLRIQERSADGRGSSLVFDGSKMTVWDSDAGVFAQANQPGSVDDAIVYFVRDLKMRLPLAPLFTTRFPAELERRLKTIDYVELTDVLGEPAHHVAGRTNAVDFQIWIADGERPLPLRVVLTYADAGRPQYWAQFSDWNLRPQVSDKTFAFEAPRDARQIAFEIQVPTIVGTPPPDGAAAKEEGQ
jgi:hypothetical protein